MQEVEFVMHMSVLQAVRGRSRHETPGTELEGVCHPHMRDIICVPFLHAYVDVLTEQQGKSEHAVVPSR